MIPKDPQLQLLGGFRLAHGGATVVVSQTSAKLLALLALHEVPLSRSRVAGALWPEQLESRAFANLRATVWRLPGAPGTLLRTVGSAMSLADTVQVDVHHARAVVRELLDGPGPRGPGHTYADLLCRQLLPDWDDDWLTFERERTRQLHIHALEVWGHALLASDDALSAVDVSITVVAAEPLRESAHVLLMNSYLACGNRADARRSYDRYRDLMRRELGLDPAVDWAELVATVPASPGQARPRRAKSLGTETSR